MAWKNFKLQLTKFVGLFLVNFVMFIIGTAIVGLGAAAQVGIKLTQGIDFTDVNFNYVAILVIILGVITMIISFFGCAGPMLENMKMIRIFSYILSVVLIVLIIINVAAYIALKVYKVSKIGADF